MERKLFVIDCFMKFYSFFNLIQNLVNSYARKLIITFYNLIITFTKIFVFLFHSFTKCLYFKFCKNFVSVK
jgi:hypothetical protein